MNCANWITEPLQVSRACCLIVIVASVWYYANVRNVPSFLNVGVNMDKVEAEHVHCPSIHSSQRWAESLWLLSAELSAIILRCLTCGRCSFLFVSKMKSFWSSAHSAVSHIKLSLLLRDLTQDICTRRDIISIRARNVSKRYFCCSPRTEWVWEHISGTVGWRGFAKPHDQLPIRLENGTLVEMTAVHVGPFAFCHCIKGLLNFYREFLLIM